MRKLYGSTSWRRVLALVLVFVMMFSVMGTSGYSVFAEGLEETGEAVVEPAVEEPAQEEEFTPQGESPGEEEAEAVVETEEGEVEVEAVEAAEEEAEEPAEEAVEEAAEDEESEEPAEAVEEEAAEGEELEAEPAEEAEEDAEEPAEEPAEEGGEEEETLIAEAAQIIEEDDGAEAPAEEAEEEAAEEAAEEVIPMGTTEFKPVEFEDAIVTITAEPYTFPEGTTVTVDEVILGRTQMDAVAKAVEDVFVTIKAYDITFYNAEGKEIQPAKPIKINIESVELAALENPQIVHIEDNNRKAEVVDIDVTDEGVEFDAEHFSVYVIVSGGETEEFRRTYHFMTEVDADGNASPFTFLNKVGEEVTIQVAKNGDKLETVNAPYQPGATLLGWYVLNGTAAPFTYTDTELRFETALDLSAMESDDDVYVAPMYEKVYYVTFHETAQGSTDDILQTKKVVFTSGSDANKVLISDVIAPQTDAVEIFYGWKLGDTEYSIYDSQNNLKTTYIEGISEDVDLYPVFKEAYWLRFVAGQTGWRAKYVPAQFVLANVKITKVPVSEREGYIFDGWYTGSMSEDGKISYDVQVTDGNGNVLVEGGLAVPGETTLYGKWSANENAKYSVMFWRQKVSDDKDAAEANKTYDFVAAQSQPRTGATGEIVSATNDDKNYGGRGDYVGFHFARTEQNSEVINADGSTVINVYYDRDIMAVNFYYQDGHQPAGATTAYTYNATTSNSNNPKQYGVLDDGNYVELTVDTETTTRVYYTYGRRQIEYGGTFYTRSGNGGCGGSGYVYTPTGYNGSNLPPAGDNTTYYTEGHDELTRRTQNNTIYNWSYGNGIPYTGTRYVRSAMNGYPYMVTFTGLYGQSFEKNNYTWPASYRWNEQADGEGTGQTLLNSFKQTANPYNLYDQGRTGSAVIYHYKQKTDGTYDQTENVYRFTAYGNAGSFHFTDKFDGFKVHSYNTGNNGFNANGGSNTNLNNTPSTYPLHVYHERQKFSITYESEGSAVHTTGKTVYFEAELKGYNYDITKVDWLNEKDHYKFTGWYADEACTTLFDFESKMPAADVIVYAGWEPLWYQIIVDPAGGVITPDIGSTYFWKLYEDTFDKYEGVERLYIEDPDGTYKYVYVDGLEDPEGTTAVRTATYVLAEEGYTGTKYRPITPADADYILVGWYVVDKDGNTTSTPYDFKTKVEGPVHIRAVWRLSGFYKVQYNATATIDEVEVSGTFIQTEPDAKYADGAKIIIQAAPTRVTQGYVFEGWEIVDETGVALDNNDGDYYQPGEQLTLDATHWATSNRLIRLAAHYSKVEISDIPVDITFLKLDANGGAMAAGAAAPEFTDVNNNLAVPVVNAAKTLVTYEDLPINQDFALETVAELFVREGYEFLGWSTNQSATSADFKGDDIVGVDNLPSKDNTLYAVWKEIPTFTVTYQYTGDIPAGANELLPTEPNHAAGDTVTVAAAPPLDGYTFSGWTTTDATVENGAFTMPEKAVTLTGSWTPVQKSYTVNYLDMDHNNAPIRTAKTDTKAYGTLVLAESEVTQITGYTFDHYDPAQITIGLDETQNVINLYYTANNNTAYTVEFYYQENGQYPTEAPTLKDETRTGKTGDQANVTDDDKKPADGYTGYVFDSANANNVLSGPIAGDGSLKLKVYFKQQFSVTYEPGDHGTFQAVTSDPVDYGADRPAAPETTGEAGYTFTGWSPNLEATVTENKTYTAQWKADSDIAYTVAYFYQEAGQYPEEPDSTVGRTGVTGTNAAVFDDDKVPTKDGYVLDATKNSDWSGTVTADGKLVLKVYFKQQFTVTYAPGEHGTFEAVTSDPVDYGAARPAEPKEIAGEEGFEFAGWDKDFADTVTETVTYTALWNAKEEPPVEPVTYTIIYHSNYTSKVSTETDETVPVEGATVIVTFNDVKGANELKFSKTSPWANGNTTYTFNSWNTKADGSGTKFTPGAYDGTGAVVQAEGSSSMASRAVRFALAMVATSSNGGTLELWAQWDESTSGGGNPSRPPRDPDPTPDPDPVVDPDEPIEDPDTPLAPIEEDTEIDDGDTPLAPAEIEEDSEIDEEATPLSPFTGDERHTAVWGFVSLLSLAGIVVVARKRREE